MASIVVVNEPCMASVVVVKWACMAGIVALFFDRYGLASASGIPGTHGTHGAFSFNFPAINLAPGLMGPGLGAAWGSPWPLPCTVQLVRDVQYIDSIHMSLYMYSVQ